MVTWTEDMVEAVFRLWKSGKSARQIAKLLPGNFSRSAVCGLIFRHNLRRAAGDPRPDPTPKPPGSGRKPGKKNGPSLPEIQLKPPAPPASRTALDGIAKAPRPAMDLEAVEIERAGRAVAAWQTKGPRLLATLNPFECRYVVAGQGHKSIFCAERAVPGRSYCAEHKALCYQKATPKPRDPDRRQGAAGPRSSRRSSFRFGRAEEQHF